MQTHHIQMQLATDVHEIQANPFAGHSRECDVKLQHMESILVYSATEGPQEQQVPEEKDSYVYL